MTKRGSGIKYRTELARLEGQGGRGERRAAGRRRQQQRDPAATTKRGRMKAPLPLLPNVALGCVIPGSLRPRGASSRNLGPTL